MFWHRISWPALLAAAVAGPAAAAPALPPDAAAVIAAVHRASAAGDLPALSSLMTESFVWSFGGDGTRQSALDHWKADPAALARLARVTKLPCRRVARDIECPRGAGTGDRAGFQPTAAGWRMTYFVAGD